VQTFLNFERYRNVTCILHELGLPSIMQCVWREIPMELGIVFEQHHVLFAGELLVPYRHCQCLCVSLCISV